MSILSVTPWAFTAGIGALIVGSAVTVPVLTNSLSGGEHYSSVAELFRTLGCATLKKKSVASNGDEKVYLCYFSSSVSRDFPKLKMFYLSGKDFAPKKIVKLKKLEDSKPRQEIEITLQDGKTINKEVNSDLLKGWISFKNSGREDQELLPETHCRISSGQWKDGYNNAYNFTCALNGEYSGNTWESQSDPFHLVYELEQE